MAREKVLVRRTCCAATIAAAGCLRNCKASKSWTWVAANAAAGSTEAVAVAINSSCSFEADCVDPIVCKKHGCCSVSS